MHDPWVQTWGFEQDPLQGIIEASRTRGSQCRIPSADGDTGNINQANRVQA